MDKNQKLNVNHKETSIVTGEGKFYHIEVRPQQEFKRFRTQDVGTIGGIERVAGQREDHSWNTVKWLINKELAHIENGRLIADYKDVQKLFDKLDSVPKHIEGDRFEAKA